MTTPTLGRVFRAALMAAVFTAVAAALAACQQQTNSAGSATQPPGTDCSIAIPMLAACVEYRSVVGDENGVSRGWLTSDPISLSGQTLNKSDTLVITTPCNILNVQVTWSAGVTTSEEITSGLIGCDAQARAREVWIRDFFDQPVAWSELGGVVTVNAGGSSIQFEKFNSPSH